MCPRTLNKKSHGRSRSTRRSAPSPPAEPLIDRVQTATSRALRLQRSGQPATGSWWTWPDPPRPTVSPRVERLQSPSRLAPRMKHETKLSRESRPMVLYDSVLCFVWLLLALAQLHAQTTQGMLTGRIVDSLAG